MTRGAIDCSTYGLDTVNPLEDESWVGGQAVYAFASHTTALGFESQSGHGYASLMSPNKGETAQSGAALW